MSASIFKRKLFELPKPNWWLWMSVGVSLSACFLLIPYNHGDGDVYSDWNTLPFWAQFVGGISEIFLLHFSFI